jgi:hypothetical protein
VHLGVDPEALPLNGREDVEAGHAHEGGPLGGLAPFAEAEEGEHGGADHRRGVSGPAEKPRSVRS